MATNRADTLDPALLRPGRLDRKIEFPLPDRRQKRLVFQVRQWLPSFHQGGRGHWGASGIEDIQGGISLEAVVELFYVRSASVGSSSFSFYRRDCQSNCLQFLPYAKDDVLLLPSLCYHALSPTGAIRARRCIGPCPLGIRICVTPCCPVQLPT